MSDTDDKDQRISELEQEVARLRSRVDDSEQGQAFFEGAPDASSPVPDASDGAAVGELQMPSRRRAILIAVAVGVVALVAIFAITYSLSTVIEPFSKKAAQALEPFEGDAETKKKAPPAAPASPELRAPGL